MICIINYGLGNVGSILNMCKHSGIKAAVSSDAEIIHFASHLILPGVGTFDNGARNLNENGLLKIISTEVLDNHKPILGICLGAQLMLESSSEGTLPGMGWIKGSCIKFGLSSGLKIPHMGWNSLYEIKDRNLFNNMPYEPPRFYFVHTYYFDLLDDANIAAITVYGINFASAFRKENIYGVQFHPEKSHKFGMQVLLNFYNIR